MNNFMKRDSNNKNFMYRNPKDVNIKSSFMIREVKNRNTCDTYQTPMNCIQSLLDNISIHEMNILEPSAASGNFIKALKLNGYDGNITAIELRHEEYSNLKEIANDVFIGDFLTLETDRKYDLIIGNPPFSKALEFLEKCFDLLSENGRMIMLLRTAFLESKQRYEFWQKHPLTGLYVLSSRPSFTGKGTDSTSYSFFWFSKNPSNYQEIKVIK